MATPVKSELIFTDACKVLDAVRGEFETDVGSLHVIPECRYNEILQLIENHYLPDAPVDSAFEITRTSSFDAQIYSRLKLNLSLMMVDRSSTEIMGAVINRILKREEVIDTEGMPKCFQDCAHFYENTERDINIFDKVGVDDFFKISILVVARKYRQHGVGRRLIEVSEKFARTSGFRAIKSEGDSVYSQRIFEKLGFEVLIDFPYDSYIYEGEPLGNRTGIHRSTKVYMKRI